jgi:hypothetical protein
MDWSELLRKRICEESRISPGARQGGMQTKDYRPTGQGGLREEAQGMVVCDTPFVDMQCWRPGNPVNCLRLPMFLGQLQERIP